MMDRILIKDLLVRCVLGLSAEERREKQDVLISVVLLVDLTKAGRSDRAEDTVDYRAVKKDILAAAEDSISSGRGACPAGRGT
jgi:D-erythro-7,8-dihydroneopterin triphosphate epimerase